MRRIGIALVGSMLVMAPGMEASARERDFMYPMWGNYRLDYHFYQRAATRGPSPGIGPAHAYCKAMGYGGAAFWDIDALSGRYSTIHIGNNSVCQAGNRCVGYRVVRCR
jgi:hypothetical protein